MGFTSLADIAERAREKEFSFWRVVLEDDCMFSQVEPEESWKKMQEMYEAMREADQGYDGSLKSASGLVGGDGSRMEAYVEAGKGLCGPFFGRVIAKALKMGESNACMKRIVAAPTAGSCGVLPAVLLTYEEECRPGENAILKAMYVAAGIGGVIAVRSSISGAKGGCQAEIGASSAMAAGALTYLGGGDTEAILHSAAMALKNLMGLVCDPVAGLVEIPCVKRNVIGAVNALSASDMALAGIRSVIPPDEVIDAMRNVGDVMSVDLRETGRGGLAGTPTGQAIFEQLQKR
ncbi:L-serine ammonia-lyase, iron-sulfur-dependent, subunit alpha [Cuneatibacter sp. NSJ-177]|uniref:L-serine ammonia-lyase, iron-sulfur-dependent, subunit alpha n=1 Tax=Cuneatibacter sp. NSJ-177 TaxID=2931401 RepID=UPI001FD5F279|nr:L-serine ammonia-lyase, iron-sulfur-dependent, subunit alpha [Cuneatibacter sp. NSJ-177]MCJ7834924.1 L-serine ammonia-lyase, iron-sulfur-dependent, subunit alpha [Cuneatibacter sp. NSJ-177]